MRGLGLGLLVASQPCGHGCQIHRARERVLSLTAPVACQPLGYATQGGLVCVAGHIPGCQKAVVRPQEIALGSAVCSWYDFGHVSSSLFPRARSLLLVVQLGKRRMNVKKHVFFT